MPAKIVTLQGLLDEAKGRKLDIFMQKDIERYVTIIAMFRAAWGTHPNPPVLIDYYGRERKPDTPDANSFNEVRQFRCGRLTKPELDFLIMSSGAVWAHAPTRKHAHYSFVEKILRVEEGSIEENRAIGFTAPFVPAYEKPRRERPAAIDSHRSALFRSGLDLAVVTVGVEAVAKWFSDNLPVEAYVQFAHILDTELAVPRLEKSVA